jgi:hypothetical protein
MINVEANPCVCPCWRRFDPELDSGVAPHLLADTPITNRRERGGQARNDSLVGFWIASLCSQ